MSSGTLLALARACACVVKGHGFHPSGRGLTLLTRLPCTMSLAEFTAKPSSGLSRCLANGRLCLPDVVRNTAGFGPG
eukprot:13422487-Alexandrium_andersonii.AAC.1